MEEQTHHTWYFYLQDHSTEVLHYDQHVGRVVVIFNETNNDGGDEVIMNYNGA